MKNSIILIRHGESLGNTDPAYYGLPDAANILSKKGVDQCIDIIEPLREMMSEDFHNTHTTILSSVYQRAKLTAQIVMAEMAHQVIEDRRINEIVHDLTGPIEPVLSALERMRSVLYTYPFNLVCFTHGMFMGNLDYKKGNALNCEIRKYDRNDFIEMINIQA